MSIRAKLYAAIALTVLGPVVAIGVALTAFGELGNRFDDVAARAADQRRALELKFAVTDMNGWQTAYGYDGGRSRPVFERAVRSTRSLLAEGQERLTSAREQALLGRLGDALNAFMALDRAAYRALRAGREAETRRIFLGPEIVHFQTMARAAGELADEQQRRADAAGASFSAARRDSRREMVALGIGAAVLIILLLVTVQDVVRLALERRGEQDPA